MKSIYESHLHLEKETRLDDLYAICGRKTYLVGAQDGSFPDTGHHVPGEMGGLWSHPIKVLDGFWLGFQDPQGTTTWLPKADKFWHNPVSSGFEYTVDGIGQISTEVFIPNQAEGMVVTYRICFLEGAPSKLRLVFLAKTELLGVWLSEQLGWEDGRDQAWFEEEEGVVVAKDSNNSWFAVLGPTKEKDGKYQIGDLRGPEDTIGQGISIQFSLELNLDDSRTYELEMAVTSSSTSQEEALASWRELVQNQRGLRKSKGEAYHHLIAQTKVELPDRHLQETFDWIKVNYEMLTRDVKDYGFGLAAGLPTYPWWFGCDNSYALQGALPLGLFELTKRTLELIADYSGKTNGNGRIIHEAVTNGLVPNPGNTQETAHFAVAVYETWLWTGDDEFLKKLYPLLRQGVLDWLLGEMDEDGDLFPSGYGIMEVAGLNGELIDTAIYTQRALTVLADMADYLGDKETGERAKKLAKEALENIENRFWLEDEGLYADVQASPNQLLSRLNQMRQQRGNQDPRMLSTLDRYEAICYAIEEKEEDRPWLFKNWVIFCPLEVGTAPQDRAERALGRMYTPEFTTEEGLYLNGNNQRSKMTISTAVAAVAQARYGFMDRALDYVNQIARIRDLRFPGAPSEMMPDYGCVVQAWTGYGIVYPIVSQFLGLRPHAPFKQFLLTPHLPTDWNGMAAKNVRIGDALVDIELKKLDGVLEIEFVVDKPGWTIQLGLNRQWLGWERSKVQVNDEVVACTDKPVSLILNAGKFYNVKVTQED